MEDVVHKNNEHPAKSRVELEDSSGTSAICVYFGGKQKFSKVHLVNYMEHV